MKHVLLIYYLYLTYLYKAVWVSDEYMLQQRMVLSNRSDVHIFSAPWGLKSSVHSSETAICMNKQGVVNLYVPLLSRAPFPCL